MQEKKLVHDLAEPLVEAQGLEIWGLEVIGNPPRKVALFVDFPPGSQAVYAEPDPLGVPPSPTIEQCEDISRQLGLALDVEDILPDHWTLEVSSPGLERKFYQLDQMRPYVGDMVEVSLLEPLDCGSGKAKSLKGRLTEVGEGEFKIEPCQIGADGEIIPSGLPPCAIPWNICRLARRIHIFKTPQKPGKAPSRKKRAK